MTETEKPSLSWKLGYILRDRGSVALVTETHRGPGKARWQVELYLASGGFKREMWFAMLWEAMGYAETQLQRKGG